MEINNNEENLNTKLEQSLNIERKSEIKLRIGQTIQNFVQDFINQLSERLEKMEETLVVDRIEGDIAVCENRENGKMKNIPLSDLPNDIREGSILKWNNDKYEIDNSEEIEKRIEQKMKDVWK